MQGHTHGPALSVILPTATDFAEIILTVSALHAQRVSHLIELVIVAPTSIEVPESAVSGFFGVTVVENGELVTSNGARVAGIRAAAAPVIVLAEDHSFPAPGWAEALIAAHEDGYAVVGPAVRNANPRSMLSWANFLLEYSPWSAEICRREMTDLPGHNSAYRRALLLEYGDALTELFEVEAVIQRDMCARGHRMLFEPAAQTDHFNFSRLGSTVSLRVNAGRAFAGCRTIGWPFYRRTLYAIASPLIPLVRLTRILRFLVSSPTHQFLVPRIFPALLLALLMDGFGEFLGYTTGAGQSLRTLGSIEFDRMRFMNARDREDYEQRLADSRPKPAFAVV